MARKGSRENPITTADLEKALTFKKLEGITIKNATLNGSFCHYGYEHEVAENTTNTVNIKSGVLAHDDLKNAFTLLNPHLAVICEEIAAGDIDDIASIPPFNDEVHQEGSVIHRVSQFTVSAFKISGSGENEGVALTGQKRLSTGEYVKLETPKVKWEDSYAFMHDLRIAVDQCVEEGERYMQGKKAPQLVQTEMSFEDDSLVEEGV